MEAETKMKEEKISRVPYILGWGMVALGLGMAIIIWIAGASTFMAGLGWFFFAGAYLLLILSMKEMAKSQEVMRDMGAVLQQIFNATEKARDEKLKEVPEGELN